MYLCRQLWYNATMKTTNKGTTVKLPADQLAKNIDLHKKWLNNPDSGKQAILTEANLYAANLSEASFYRANLSEANLKGADLSEANLKGANLIRPNAK